MRFAAPRIPRVLAETIENTAAPVGSLPCCRKHQDFFHSGLWTSRSGQIWQQNNVYRFLTALWAGSWCWRKQQWVSGNPVAPQPHSRYHVSQWLVLHAVRPPACTQPASWCHIGHSQSSDLAFCMSSKYPALSSLGIPKSVVTKTRCIGSLSAGALGQHWTCDLFLCVPGVCQQLGRAFGPRLPWLDHHTKCITTRPVACPPDMYWGACCCRCSAGMSVGAGQQRSPSSSHISHVAMLLATH